MKIFGEKLDFDEPESNLGFDILDIFGDDEDDEVDQYEDMTTALEYRDKIRDAIMDNDIYRLNKILSRKPHFIKYIKKYPFLVDNIIEEAKKNGDKDIFNVVEFYFVDN